MNTAMDTEIVRERTLGDGMERIDLEIDAKHDTKEFNLQIPQKASQSMINSMRPIVPSTKIYPTVPKYIPKERRKPKYLIRKPKEPKFIPYEPFKAAVQPILMSKRKVSVGPVKVSKNNIEIHHLVSQMTDLRTSELAKTEPEVEDIIISKKEWEEEKRKYDIDIKNLRESNSVLENQLKLQTQVNSELKTLLVAAVGEDLETRVQHLTEDKLQLARALLNSANHLTTHQEQTEWLSGQCEVWRSKFLASSLMVEELAKWKSALTTRIKEFQLTMGKILEDHRQVHRALIKTAHNIRKVSNHFEIPINRVKLLDSSDINSLSILNYELSQDLFDHFFTYNEEEFGEFYNKMMSFRQRTQLEDRAYKILQEPITINSSNQDELYKAVLGEAGTAANDQSLSRNTSHTTCCSHCIGEIKDI